MSQHGGAKKGAQIKSFWWSEKDRHTFIPNLKTSISFFLKKVCIWTKCFDCLKQDIGQTRVCSLLTEWIWMWGWGWSYRVYTRGYFHSCVVWPVAGNLSWNIRSTYVSKNWPLSSKQTRWPVLNPSVKDFLTMFFYELSRSDLLFPFLF